VTVAVVMLGLAAVYLGWRTLAPGSCALLFPTAAQWSESGAGPGVIGDCSPAARLASAWSTILFVVSLFLVSGYAFLRRRTDPAAGALLLLASGLLASTTVAVVGLPVRDAGDGWPRRLFLVNVELVYSIAWGGLLAFAALFPVALGLLRGHPGRRAALIAAPLLATMGGAVVLGLIGEPFGSLGWVNGTIQIQSSITILWLLLSLAVYVFRIVRLRRDAGDPIERQQLLWIGGSGIAAAMLVLAFWMVPQLVTGSELLPIDAIGVPGLFFVVGLTIALLRYRLFDLDALLGRSLVYSALSLLVVVIYLAAVATLAAMFSAESATPTAVAGAVVVAIVVNPLRVVLQRLVNRLLYGDRDDPYAALSRVAEQLTATAARRVTLAAVAADVGRAMRVPYVIIKWRTEDRWELAEFGREPAGGTALYEVPLTFRDEQVGWLGVSNRGPGERFSPAERRLLADLSRQGGAAAHELALSRALQRSRERLVLAREEERRVIRRTLHDDIGPTIAGIALRAETVRQLADRPAERDGMTTALAGIGRDAAAAASALRELSYELRPPALDDRGLLLALRDRALQLAPLRVEITAPIDGEGLQGVGIDSAGDGRGDLPAAVEVAAYRIAVAAMTNVARHAAASRCWVTLTLADHHLTVLVEDDGRGLPADFRPGVGVLSMRERAGELGGVCVHEQRSGGGTRVRATLPVTGGCASGSADE
jgi:signal transduction histidine kinase